mmetsp:Transcript_56708/g.147708  ORF Transcript_56708/g.147708 Transcript_56708/m.147708 type:complete len:228 (-) Transcript_56708:99-782(-)
MQDPCLLMPAAQSAAITAFRANTAHAIVENGGTDGKLKKTRLCYYRFGNQCKYGPRCCFAHSEEELRTPPDFHKTKMCTFFAQGFCKVGSACRFAHGTGDLRIPAGDGGSVSPSSGKVPPPPMAPPQFMFASPPTMPQLPLSSGVWAQWEQASAAAQAMKPLPPPVLAQQLTTMQPPLSVPQSISVPQGSQNNSEARATRFRLELEMLTDVLANMVKKNKEPMILSF